MEVEAFAKAVVQGVLDGGQLLLGDLAVVGALGQVVAQQTVSVFVGSAMLRTAWIAEEDVHGASGAEFLVLAHFAALVVSHGLAQQFWDGSKASLETMEDVVCCGAIKFDEQDPAAEAFDNGSYGRSV